MVNLCIVGVFIYSIACVEPFSCPRGCVCEEKEIVSCNFLSPKELSGVAKSDGLAELVHSRTRRAVKPPTNNSLTSPLGATANHDGHDDCTRNCSSNTIGQKEGNTASPQYHSIAVIGLLSIVAFVTNVAMFVHLIRSDKAVIELLGLFLMLFNAVLSTYGMGMALYLLNPTWRQYDYYCQFFTSIKLFALGAGVYSFIFLLLHRSIKGPGDENLSEKGILRHALFKGTAAVLQTMCLSGFLCVLSWIKLKDWKYLCAIMTPDTRVDLLLLIIEILYYTVAGLLIAWYLTDFIYPRCKILFGRLRDKLKGDGNAVHLIRESPLIKRDFPIFLMLFLSFCIWVGGFACTLPKFKHFSFETSATVRVCALITPLILQPIIFFMRKTSCYRCRRHEEMRTIEVKLECKCTRFYTCPSCQREEDLAIQEDGVKLTSFTETTSLLPRNVDDVTHKSPGDSDTDTLADIEGEAEAGESSAQSRLPEEESDAPKAEALQAPLGHLDVEDGETIQLLISSK